MPGCQASEFKSELLEVALCRMASGRVWRLMAAHAGEARASRKTLRFGL